MGLLQWLYYRNSLFFFHPEGWVSNGFYSGPLNSHHTPFNGQGLQCKCIDLLIDSVHAVRWNSPCAWRKLEKKICITPNTLICRLFEIFCTRMTLQMVLFSMLIMTYLLSCMATIAWHMTRSVKDMHCWNAETNQQEPTLPGNTSYLITLTGNAYGTLCQVVNKLIQVKLSQISLIFSPTGTGINLHWSLHHILNKLFQNMQQTEHSVLSPGLPLSWRKPVLYSDQKILSRLGDVLKLCGSLLSTDACHDTQIFPWFSTQLRYFLCATYLAFLLVINTYRGNLSLSSEIKYCHHLWALNSVCIQCGKLLKSQGIMQYIYPSFKACFRTDRFLVRGQWHEARPFEALILIGPHPSAALAEG